MGSFRFYRKSAEEASTEIRNLQNALMLLDDKEDGEKTDVYIERVKANAEKEKRTMQEAEKQMLQIQTEFFKEIKNVADEVGIYMPEPKDIEVLSDKITDPLTILQQYNKEHKKLVSKETKEEILDVFRGITPVFECEPGGSKYKSIIEETLSEIEFPKGEEIKFGSDINYAELIKTVLQGTTNKNDKIKDVKKDA